MQAYCMKCRKKVEIKNPKAITMKNKRPATQGICPTCGTKVFRFRAKQILEERQTSSLIELTPSPISKFPQSDDQHPKKALPRVADVPPGQYKHRRHTHH